MLGPIVRALCVTSFNPRNTLVSVVIILLYYILLYMYYIIIITLIRVLQGLNEVMHKALTISRSTHYIIVFIPGGGHGNPL